MWDALREKFRLTLRELREEFRLTVEGPALYEATRCPICRTPIAPGEGVILPGHQRRFCSSEHADEHEWNVAMG